MNDHPRRIGHDAAGADSVDRFEPQRFTAPPEFFQCRRADWALEYARRGWHVFPLHSVRDGRCSCGRDCGKNAGKPATTDSKQIAAWWAKWPDANIGIATGKVSELIVIDIDGREGDEAWQRLLAQNGQPSLWTATVQTARGLHLYFELPAGSVIPCSTGGGLDVRGDGGYVVAPPSIHASGRVYEWID
jgi:putative DNA primase/helicase